MIQIYSPDNRAFDKNGDSVLLPSLCEAEAELCGSWVLNLRHPIDDEGRWKYIVKEAVIAAPTFMGEKQCFRVDEVDKQDEEVIVKAYPVFFDSADEVFIMDQRPTAKTGQQALDILTSGTRYFGESDIKAGGTAYFIRRNLMDCLFGDEPSFLSTWGGEPLYYNWKVILNKRAGGDYGAEVRYGKNMEGISYKEDMSNVVTRIVPVAYNGRTLSTEYVDSPLIKKYAKIYTRAIKFEDVKFHEDLSDSEDTEGIIVCYSQAELDKALTKKCQEQFEAGIDLYAVTIDVDMVALENTEEYREFKDLVKIGLGDDVSCVNTRLGITTRARAIGIVWNCIANSPREVKLGDYEKNILTDWNSTIEKIENSFNDDGTINAERVAGILNGIRTQIKVQSTAAQKVETRAILFEDLDEASPMYGAMSIGTQGFQIANKRTADGRDWEWSTAFTAQGGYANVLIAGLLADKTGNNSWNLDTGELKIKSSSILNNYVVIENGKMYLYEGGTGADQRRAIFDHDGSKFYRDGYYVGRIGTNNWASNNTHKGLVFDLEALAKYMTWAIRENEDDDTYTVKFTYSKAGSMFDEEGLHVSTPLYGHSYEFYNLDIRGASANGYTAADNKSIPVITNITKNSDGSLSWTKEYIRVRSGMITAVPDSSADI